MATGLEAQSVESEKERKNDCWAGNSDSDTRDTLNTFSMVYGSLVLICSIFHFSDPKDCWVGNSDTVYCEQFPHNCWVGNSDTVYCEHFPHSIWEFDLNL
ncbi:hypothetical protein SLA2020_465630 [Shorea laevis]